MKKYIFEHIIHPANMHENLSFKAHQHLAAHAQRSKHFVASIYANKLLALSPENLLIETSVLLTLSFGN